MLDVSENPPLLSIFDLYGEIQLQDPTAGIGIREFKMDGVRSVHGKPVDLRQIASLAPNLRTLSLAGDNVSSLANFSLCRNMSSLQHLNLSNVGLQETPLHLLSECSNLTELDISSNDIAKFDKPFRQFMEKLSETQTIQLDITNNPMLCHCDANYHDVIAFFNWLKTTDVTIVNKDQLQCTGPNGVEMLLSKDIDEFYDLCSVKEEIAIAVVSALSVVLLLILIYKLFRNFLKIKTFYIFRFAALTNDDNNYRFGAFVSYHFNQSDDALVRDLVDDHLKTHCNINCCLPEAEHGLGDEVDIMSDLISRSYVSIVILSRMYDDSIQSHQDFSLIQKISLQSEQTKPIIVILRDEFKHRQTTSSKRFCVGNTVLRDCDADLKEAVREIIYSAVRGDENIKVNPEAPFLDDNST